MTPRSSAVDRACAVLAAAAALATLPGCGRLLHHAHAADVTARATLRAARAADTTAAPETPRDPLALATAAAAVAPREPYWPYHVAELELARDSSAAAERALRESLTRDRDYAPALALLTKLEFQSGRNLDAIDRLEAARRRDAASGRPFPTELTADLALQYDAIDRIDRSAPLAATLPADGPPDARTAAVFIRLRGAAPDSAAALAERAAHEHPRSAADRNNLGIARLRAGDTAGARAAFLDAIRLDATLAGPYYNLAILDKFYRFDDDAAARWYAEYRARSNDDPDGLARVFAAPAAGVAHATPEEAEAH